MARNQSLTNPQAIRQKPFEKTDRATGSGRVVGSSFSEPSGGVVNRRNAIVVDGCVGGKGVRDTGSRGHAEPQHS